MCAHEGLGRGTVRNSGPYPQAPGTCCAGKSLPRGRVIGPAHMSLATGQAAAAAMQSASIAACLFVLAISLLLGVWPRGVEGLARLKVRRGVLPG
jgi:hypothetical protein